MCRCQWSRRASETPCYAVVTSSPSVQPQQHRPDRHRLRNPQVVPEQANITQTCQKAQVRERKGHRDSRERRAYVLTGRWLSGCRPRAPRPTRGASGAGLPVSDRPVHVSPRASARSSITSRRHAEVGKARRVRRYGAQCTQMSVIAEVAPACPVGARWYMSSSVRRRR